MTSLRKRSPLWEYFNINSHNKKFAVCLLCNVTISRGGEGKKAGTSAMKNHMKTKHPCEFQALYQGSATSLATIPLAITEASSSSILTKKQSTILESLERKLLSDVNDAIAKKYHYLIGEMIALDNQPLSIVENTGLIRLLEQALPCYKMPSSTYVSKEIHPDIYNRICEKIKWNISSALAISVTCEIWTCSHNNVSYLSITAHWLSTEFKLEHGVLALKPFSGLQTGENMAKEFNIVANRWDIEHSKIHLFIHNSNKSKDVQTLEYDYDRCFIHSLQEAINESLKYQPEVTAMIVTCRGLVTHLNESESAKEKLLAIQKELNIPENKLMQDITTRWNSTFYMIECLLEQKRAISLFLADNDTFSNLTPQWCLMEQYIKLLKPFEEITKITSSGVSCVSEVIPHVAALKKYLDKDETKQRTPDLSRMRVSLKAELESHFNTLSYDSNYLVATFLDPRFKTNYLGIVEAERARQKILLEFIKLSCDETSTSSDLSSTPIKKSRVEETGSPVSREAHDTFWDCFNEVANENDNSLSHDHEKNVMACEIDYYLKSVRIDRNRDPYIWWSANATQYPNLTKFVRVYLSALCSSVYSERLFSEPGLVYEDKRNGLFRQQTINIEQLAFIHYNLPLVHYDY